jgi:hypothetical protein
MVMPPRPTRLLCTGEEPEVLRTRCAVLRHCGYDAQVATLTVAEILLRTEEFDLIIVSAWLGEWERGRILSAAGKTPAYVLPGFMLPREMLAQVDLLLPGR